MKNCLTKHIISIELRKKIRLNRGMRTIYNSCKVTRYFSRIKRFICEPAISAASTIGAHTVSADWCGLYKWFKADPAGTSIMYPVQCFTA